jgi:probable rRNA maturation factor
MASVEFLYQISSFKLSTPRKISNWIKAICSKEHREAGAITYVFCSDEYLRSLNQDFLRHNTYTDILSFDLSEGQQVAGEIYISIDRIRENAVNFNESFENELRRVMAHGILHFLGYKDKSPTQKAQMRRKEEACLSLWK